MTKDYSILYTHFNEDKTYVHYCSDGYCRLGSVESDTIKRYIPKWIDDEGNEYIHGGELPDKERLKIIENFVNNKSYLNDYWMRWLENSRILYEGDEFLQNFYNCINYYDEYEFNKVISMFDSSTKVSDKIQEIANRLKEKKMSKYKDLYIDIKKHLCLKLDTGKVIKVESFDPITGNIVFEPYKPSENEPKITGTGMDYKKEFEDLLNEFDLLENNYDNLKEMYDELKEKVYLDSLLITEYEAEIETLKSDYAKLKQEYLNKSNTCYSLLKEVRRLNEVNADLIEQDLGTEYD